FTEPSRMTTNDRAESNLAWAPDSKTLSYLSTSDKYPFIGPSRIHLITATKVTVRSLIGYTALGEPKILEPQFEGYVTKHEWSPDGKFIYFTADIGVSRHIYRIATDSWKPERRTKQVDMQGAFSLSRQNGLMAYLIESPTHPADVAITRVQAELDPV